LAFAASKTPTNFWYILSGPVYQVAMFDWLRYRYKLAALQRYHRRHMNSLRKSTEPTERQEENVDEELERFDNEMQIHRIMRARLQTNYLCNLAEKRLVQIPEAEAWINYERFAVSVLTDEAIRELRVALRADQRERLEIVRSWVVPILTGVLGFVIGLLTKK
jgi:hypothetical protein